MDYSHVQSVSQTPNKERREERANRAEESDLGRRRKW